jgi:hypothetical protein
MNERQRYGLSVLAEYEGELIEASVVRAVEWRAAQESGDDALIWKLRTTKGNVGWGHTLSWLAQNGYARREFSGFSNTWRYAITDAGKAELESA